MLFGKAQAFKTAVEPDEHWLLNGKAFVDKACRRIGLVAQPQL